MLLRWLALSALGALVGCAGPLPHAFVPQDARDYRLPFGNDGERAPVLLVPAGVRLDAARRAPAGFYVCKDCGSDVDRAVGGWREGYRGPARVFLSSGAHHYVLGVTTAGGVVELELDLLVKPQERFQLEVIETSDKVEVSVLKLTENEYRALYPHGSGLP